MSMTPTKPLGGKRKWAQPAIARLDLSKASNDDNELNKLMLSLDSTDDDNGHSSVEYYSNSDVPHQVQSARGSSEMHKTLASDYSHPIVSARRVGSSDLVNDANLKTRRSSNVPHQILDSSAETMYILNHTSINERKHHNHDLKSPHLKSFKSETMTMKDIEQLPEYRWIIKQYIDDAKSTVDVSHKLLGDNLCYILSASLPPSVHHLSLQNNRISSNGMVRVIKSFNNPKLSIQSLDLSENIIKRQGMNELCKYLQNTKTLTKLTLKKMNITDIIAKSLCQSIQVPSVPSDDTSSHIATLLSLCISDNKIEDNGAKALAAMLRLSTITELDVSWNSIKHVGASALADSLKENKSLTSLDISWNAIGTSSDQHRSVAKAVSDMLATNSALTHLDISHNQLNANDCACIGEGLKLNHSLLGLHITGNQGKVDAYGQLGADPTSWPLESAHAMTRIIGGRVSGREAWSLRASCWICDQWRETKFNYDMTQDEVFAITNNVGNHKGIEVFPPFDIQTVHNVKVKLLTSFDQWVPESLLRISDRQADVAVPGPSYELYRMVPPGDHYFVFSFDDNNIFYDPLQPHVSTDTIIEQGHVIPEGLAATFPAFVNTTHVDGLTSSEQMLGVNALFLTKVQPRLKTTDQATFIKWVVTDSVFYACEKKYSDSHMLRCFAVDWTMCKHSKLKDTALVGRLEMMIIKHFRLLTDVFTHYCCLYAGEVFFMTIGAFNEFLQKCRIIESRLDVTASNATTPSAKADVGGSVVLPDINQSSLDILSISDASNTGSSSSSSSGNTSSKKGGNGCTRTEVDMIFIANSITGPRHEHNGRRSLCRFQFLDSLCALANAKFVSVGTCKDLSTALEKLIVEHIIPYAERDDGEVFRQTVLLTEEIDIVVKRNMKVLERVFKAHTGAENLPLEPKTMCIREWFDICEAASLSDANLNERPMKLAYCRSKCLDANIFDGNATFKKMNFLEFLEAVVRSAQSIRDTLRTYANIDRSSSKPSLSASPSHEGLAPSSSASALTFNTLKFQLDKEDASGKLVGFMRPSTPPLIGAPLTKTVTMLRNASIESFNGGPAVTSTVANRLGHRDKLQAVMPVDSIGDEALTAKDIADCLENVIKRLRCAM